MQDENVIVLEHGSLEAQKYAKAMSSPTSADLFNALTGNPQSATALAERTGLPLTTVKYHLENMLSAGLVEISNTRWSEKGREMKIYSVKDQVVVFAPRKTVDLKGIVERYGTMAGAIAIGCSLVIAIPQMLNRFTVGAGYPIRTSDTAEVFAIKAATGQVAESVSWMPMIHNVVLGFLVISLAVLALMMVYELYIVRKNG
ncbi:MAG: helix-turn-helix domain-containing protein [Methanocorpusculum sp.]|uniref:ArsR/SmtB family transcription factor n=1 Tax=Methanocorpusculum sp. TaxID=2058474 RepID=UPI00271CD83C|nr:helix-turn-helix domain-containing protein [Methanocorpusculum sp.]MDO9523409.1 helix-turn-helix domain-containing protein [Methanocorpusculum sp.]